MNPILVSHFFSAVMMITIPIVVGVFLIRRFNISQGVWWIGGITFITSQVGHIPFNLIVDIFFDRGWLPAPPARWAIVFSAGFLGLSAGMWESWFRWIAYRWWAKQARTWRAGIILGAGHGGIESILLGLLSFYTLVNIWYLHDKNLIGIFPASQIPLVQQQLAAYWSQGWYLPLLGILERVFTIIFHITASVIVLQAFTRNKLVWVWLAVGWHAFIDGLVAVYLPAVWRNFPWWTFAVEATLGIFAIINFVILIKLKTPETVKYENIEVLSEPLQFHHLPEFDVTNESLERTKYND